MAETSTKTRKTKADDWKTQVYDPEGEWVGFFKDDETARKWVGKREGYEITERKPERKPRPDPDSSSDGTPAADQEAQTAAEESDEA